MNLSAGLLASHRVEICHLNNFTIYFYEWKDYDLTKKIILSFMFIPSYSNTRIVCVCVCVNTLLPSLIALSQFGSRFTEDRGEYVTHFRCRHLFGEPHSRMRCIGKYEKISRMSDCMYVRDECEAG